MVDEDTRKITVIDKNEPICSVEQTRTGLIFAPDVDIFENAEGITLLADMPGVKPENLDIDLTDDILTIDAEGDDIRHPGEEQVLVEYESGRYFRQFSLSDVIDQSRIVATLKEGVLQLMLPKIEKTSPRKIKIDVSDS